MAPGSSCYQPLDRFGACEAPEVRAVLIRSQSCVTVPLPATVAPRVDAASVRRDPVTRRDLTLLHPRAAMQTIQDRLTLLLRAYRTIRYCDACLALKMGAFPREVREAVAMIGDGFQISSGRCSDCLLDKTVVRALAA